MTSLQVYVKALYRMDDLKTYRMRIKTSSSIRSELSEGHQMQPRTERDFFFLNVYRKKIYIRANTDYQKYISPTGDS